MVDRRLTDEEAAAVFRRAAELDDARRPDDRGLDRRAVERAALEVGLAPTSVHQALAELDAGRLGLERRRPWRWRDQVATVERHLPQPAAAARRHLEAYLKLQTLRPARRRGAVSVWELATGLAASVLRGTDLSGRLRLKDVSQVTLCVVEDDDPRGCHVRVDLDFRRSRNTNRLLAALGAAGGVGIGGAGVAVALLGLESALVSVPVGGAVSTAAFFAARGGYADVVTRAVNAIELTLDDLDDPDAPGLA